MSNDQQSPTNTPDLSPAHLFRRRPTEMVAELGAAMDRLWAGQWPFGEAPVAIRDEGVVVRLPEPLKQVSRTLIARTPRSRVSDRRDAFVVTAELPGVAPDDLDIAIEGGALVIQGERRDAVARGPLAARDARFHLRVPLDTDAAVDQITARFTNGLLTITVPKAVAHIRVS